MISPVTNVKRDENGVIEIGGKNGTLKFYGYSEKEAINRYVAEYEFKKMKKGESIYV